MRSERKQEEKKEQGNKRFATILAVIYIIATAALLVTTFMVGVCPYEVFCLPSLQCCWSSAFLSSDRCLESQANRARERNQPEKVKKGQHRYLRSL